MQQSTNNEMNLYFAPLACSLATRIALYEAGADIEYTYVDTDTKRLKDGSNYFEINPMGQVPALCIGHDTLLTENAAILQHVAESFPDAALMPAAPLERARLRQWLGFISTELHKAVFIPLLDPKAAVEVKAYSREKLARRMDVLQHHLTGREFLLNDFSVADAYLVTVLNWGQASGVDIGQWPEVREYYKRLTKRPSIAKGIAEEWAMYQDEQARKAAA
jgi:glutathione S-transferase